MYCDGFLFMTTDRFHFGEIADGNGDMLSHLAMDKSFKLSKSI